MQLSRRFLSNSAASISVSDGPSPGFPLPVHPPGRAHPPSAIHLHGHVFLPLVRTAPFRPRTSISRSAVPTFPPHLPPSAPPRAAASGDAAAENRANSARSAERPACTPSAARAVPAAARPRVGPARAALARRLAGTAAPLPPFPTPAGQVLRKLRRRFKRVVRSVMVPAVPPSRRGPGTAAARAVTTRAAAVAPAAAAAPARARTLCSGRGGD